MTNLGFRLAMNERGIEVVETAVGDRFVLDALETGGHSLGGEQSGHVIFPDLATTGDGLLTGVQLLDVMSARGGRCTSWPSVMTRLPQVLRNVRVASTAAKDLDDRIAADVAAARERARRARSRPRASKRHRAARAGDGRGDRRRSRPTRSPTASPKP